MTIGQLVDRERRGVRTIVAGSGALVAFGATVLVLAAGAVALDGGRWITRPGAPGLVWLVALALAGATGYWTWRRVVRDASLARVAAAIERERSLRTGMLRGALEVADGSALGRHAARSIATRLSGSGPVLAPSMRRQALRGAGIAAGAALLALLLTGAAHRSAPDGWQALLHPIRAWDGTLLPPLAFERAPGAVLRGEPVRLTLRAAGRRSVQLHARATGSEWAVRTIAVHGDSATASLGPMDADITLVATDGRAISDTVTIVVTDRPFLGDITLRAQFPRYLGRAAEVLASGEPMRLPRGTVLEVSGRASTALTAVALARAADTVRMLPDEHTFAGRFAPATSGRWSWNATGVAGSIDDVPPPLEVEILPDSVPRVEIMSPARDSMIALGDRVVLALFASDDHGLAGVSLRSWRVTAGGRALAASSERLSGPVDGLWSGHAELDIASRGLEAGDELHIIATATDQSPWAQRGESRELVLKIPSLSERREMARDAADSAVARAASTAEAQKQLARRTGDAARSRGNRAGGESQPAGGERSREPEAMSYESAERAEALVREQRELAQRVKEVAEAARALERQLRQAGALDAELASKLKEAQALLQDALTPELAERMRALEEAVQQLSGDEARAALKDLALQQQRLREQLERSAEMLRRAAMEGAMQTLRDEAQEIARQERALGDSMAQARAVSPDAARRLEERARELARDVEALAERLARQDAQSGAEQVKAAEPHAKASAEAMRKVAQHADSPGGQGAKGPEQRTGAEPGKPDAGKGEGAREQADSGGAQAMPEGAGQRGAEAKAGERASAGSEGGGDREGREQAGGRPSPSQQAAGEAARQAGERMERAAERLAQAREQQVREWKAELAGELDQSIQEMMQLAREQQGLEQQLRQGTDPSRLRGDQSAVQQGVNAAASRLQEAGAKSSLLSARSQRAVGEAQRAVQQATDQVTASRGSTGPAAGAMRDAAEALNRAAASLVRDREGVNQASSASGFSEMLAQMAEMAKKQGGVNAGAQGLMQLPSAQQASEEARAMSRALARQQRSVAQGLEDLGDGDQSGKMSELAREARQLAEALDRGRLDPGTLARQQQLLTRLLDAGRTYDDDDQDESPRREARSASGADGFEPAAGDASGRAAGRFREPTWDELRGLTGEERRAVIEYFRRINGDRR